MISLILGIANLAMVIISLKRFFRYKKESRELMDAHKVFLTELGRVYEDVYRSSCRVQDVLVDNPELAKIFGDLADRASSKAISLQLYAESGIVFKDVKP